MAEPVPSILNAAEPCSPLAVPLTHTALLLLDFHQFIVNMLPPGEIEKAVAVTASLRDWARKNGALVIHCLIDLQATAPRSFKTAKRFDLVQERLASAEADQLRETPSVAATEGEPVLLRQPGIISAMMSRGLSEILSKHGIKSLILTGFGTSGCVFSTAKQAPDLGYIVTVVEDAIGDRDERQHRMILDNLLVGQCHIVKAKQLMDAFAEKS